MNDLILLNIMGISLLLMAFCVGMMIRNRFVYKERTKILELVSKRAQWIIEHGIQDWEQPYRDFNEVSYYEMAFKFWKPIKSFYNYERFKIPEEKVANK